MSRWLKITLISVAVIFGLLLSTMVIVPWQVKKQGSKWIADNTQRTLSIEKVSFNPFTLTLEISGAKLTEQNNEHPFVTFSSLLLSGSIKSIIRQAIILDRVELDDPFVNLELLGKQEFNFSDFARLGSD
ncbi:MAG: AsmA family protein, partial [Desulfuromusa sp.]|nr:AsmA family protein [Desulfuromusa sp.]